MEVHIPQHLPVFAHHRTKRLRHPVDELIELLNQRHPHSLLLLLQDNFTMQLHNYPHQTQQIRGILFQWLDYRMTTRVSDPTNDNYDEDELLNVLACLNRVLPLSPVQDYRNNDASQWIVLRAVFGLLKDHSAEPSFRGTTHLLKVLEYYLASICQLAVPIQQQLVLILLRIYVEEQNAVSLRLLQKLCASCVYAAIALECLQGTVTATTADPLFQLQCLLRTHQQLPASLDVSSLVLNANSDNSNYQTIDCLVWMAARGHCIVDVSQALVRILTDLGTHPALCYLVVPGLEFCLHHQEALDVMLHSSYTQAILENLSEISLADWKQISFELGDLSVLFDWNDQSVPIAASEILWTIVSAVLETTGLEGKLPVSSLVQLCQTYLVADNEHLNYMAVRVMCREHAELFQHIVMEYADLNTNLADILQDDATDITKQTILEFWASVLHLQSDFASILARQEGVLEALPKSNHPLASVLLFQLSDSADNLRILAKQQFVIPAMIRFMRDHPNEERKQRILQLASVM